MAGERIRLSKTGTTVTQLVGNKKVGGFKVDRDRRIKDQNKVQDRGRAEIAAGVEKGALGGATAMTKDDFQTIFGGGKRGARLPSDKAFDDAFGGPGATIATGKTGGTKPPKKSKRRTTITQGVADIVQGKMPGGPAGAGLPGDAYGVAGSTRIRTATSPAGGKGATKKAGGKGATKKAGGKGATTVAAMAAKPKPVTVTAKTPAANAGGKGTTAMTSGRLPIKKAATTVTAKTPTAKTGTRIYRPWLAGSKTRPRVSESKRAVPYQAKALKRVGSLVSRRSRALDKAWKAYQDNKLTLKQFKAKDKKIRNYFDPLTDTVIARYQGSKQLT